MNSTGEERFAEVDLLRGLAVLGMIGYHILFDLSYLSPVELHLPPKSWTWLADPIAGTFFFLVGLSLAISYDRASSRSSTAELSAKYILRGIMILTVAAGITVVTYILFPDRAIVFGALHFIGTSIILSYPFLVLTSRREGSSLFVGFFGILFLSYPLFDFYQPELGSFWLLPLGFPPQGLLSLDYYPLVPWFGLVLVGIVCGRFFYPQGKRKFAGFGSSPFFAPLKTLGRHALAVYLLHQPLLIGALYLFRRLR